MHDLQTIQFLNSREQTAKRRDAADRAYNERVERLSRAGHAHDDIVELAYKNCEGDDYLAILNALRVLYNMAIEQGGAATHQKEAAAREAIAVDLQNCISLEMQCMTSTDNNQAREAAYRAAAPMVSALFQMALKGGGK